MRAQSWAQKYANKITYVLGAHLRGRPKEMVVARCFQKCTGENVAFFSVSLPTRKITVGFGLLIHQDCGQSMIELGVVPTQPPTSFQNEVKALRWPWQSEFTGTAQEITQSIWISKVP